MVSEKTFMKFIFFSEHSITHIGILMIGYIVTRYFLGPDRNTNFLIIEIIILLIAGVSEISQRAK